jgi:uncharacterized protein YbjT (DUF2867 family)
MRILVTGITGYVGAELAPRLVEAGHDVRGFARDPARVTVDVPVVKGDATTGAGLEEALDGIDVAYFLIHSMESGTNDHYSDLERRSAELFATRAADAGVKRVVYVGGIVPQDSVSTHLESRLAVERALLEGAPDAVGLRASIVIAARSRSFRFLVRLVERMPLLAIPGWHANSTQPIDGRDVMAFLESAATTPGVGGRAWDIAGPDVLTYGGMMERIRDLMLVFRKTLRLPITMTPVASKVAAAVAGEDPGLIEPLMEGLETDILPTDPEASAEAFGVRLHKFDAAVERALREWEEVEPVAAR